MNNEFNATTIYVETYRIKKATQNAITAVEIYRKKLKEKYIKELMEPYRIFFIKRQRTLEEAEKELEDLSKSHYSKYWQYQYEKNWLRNRSLDLLNACFLTSKSGMYLSLEDTCLVGIWENKGEKDYVNSNKNI